MIKNIVIIGGSGKIGTTFKKAFEKVGLNVMVTDDSTKDQENDENNVYVDAISGQEVAIRSEQWRLWDLMWGLHIMDWETRDEINNLLLKLFSVLALISSLTGVFIFFRWVIKSLPSNLYGKKDLFITTCIGMLFFY